jgi:hypothetical protein
VRNLFLNIDNESLIDSKFKSSFNYLHNIDEVYFGKSPELIAMENQLDIFREKYMGRYVLNMSVNSDPDLLKFDRMMEDFFGFGCFTIHIHNQAICNAFTLPVDYRFDVNSNDDLIANKKTFKFKKEKDYSIILGIYSGLIFNSGFTTEEIMACILHEVGHNFNASINRSNGVLVDNYKSLMYVSYMVLILMGQFNLGFIQNNNSYRVIVDKTGKELRKNKKLCVWFYDLIKQMQAITIAVKNIEFDIIRVLTLGLVTPLILILNGCIGLLRNLKDGPINILINILIKCFMLKARYTDEESADNLATMYGYGPATISLQHKFQSKEVDQSSVIMNAANNIPVIGALIHLVELPCYIVVGALDEHPEGLVRCKDQIELLKREVNKNDIDPKMKKVILSDIKECEKQIARLTEVTSVIEDPYAARKAYNRLLDTFSGGKFKKTVFGGSDKFDQYDLAYNRASSKSESTLMEDMFLYNDIED